MVLEAKADEEAKHFGVDGSDDDLSDLKRTYLAARATKDEKSLDVLRSSCIDEDLAFLDESK